MGNFIRGAIGPDLFGSDGVSGFEYGWQSRQNPPTDVHLCFHGALSVCRILICGKVVPLNRGRPSVLCEIRGPAFLTVSKHGLIPPTLPIIVLYHIILITSAAQRTISEDH